MRHAPHRQASSEERAQLIALLWQTVGSQRPVSTTKMDGREVIAAGARGFILEVHPDPNSALCDGRQSITPEQLQAIVHETRLITQVMQGKASLSYVA